MNSTAVGDETVFMSCDSQQVNPRYQILPIKIDDNEWSNIADPLAADAAR